MTYFADLSEYEYASDAAPLPRNVGWLDAEHVFPCAEPQPELVEALRAYCTVQVNVSRGLDSCWRCVGERVAMDVGHKKVRLGSAEIRVFGEDGGVYAAPDLVFHYVVAHGYRPPDVFVEAALRGPRPPNAVYFERLAARQTRWTNSPLLDELPEAFRFEKQPDGSVVRVRVERRSR